MSGSQGDVLPVVPAQDAKRRTLGQADINNSTTGCGNEVQLRGPTSLGWRFLLLLLCPLCLLKLLSGLQDLLGPLRLPVGPLRGGRITNLEDFASAVAPNAQVAARVVRAGAARRVA